MLNLSLGPGHFVVLVAAPFVAAFRNLKLLSQLQRADLGERLSPTHCFHLGLKCTFGKGSWEESSLLSSREPSALAEHASTWSCSQLLTTAPIRASSTLLEKQSLFVLC